MSELTGSDAQIREAAGIIRSGGVVAFPTETVYGLGASAFDEKAVARVFEIKRRPYFDPLITHIDKKERLYDLALDVPALAQRLIDAFWPGPLTVILPKKPVVPDIVTAGLPGAALRMPSNEIALKLIRAAGVPVAAPSANLFGSVSPTAAEHVRAQLGGTVDMIIDGGECSVGIESTVISFMEERPALLRPGGTALEEIEEVIGKVTVPGEGEQVNRSPGRGGAHYATSAPLVLIGGVDEIGDIVNNVRINDGNGVNGNVCIDGINTMFTDAVCINPLKPVTKIGLIALSPASVPDPAGLPSAVVKIEYLSASGDLREAACRLFAAMRRLDAAGVDTLAALPVPTAGLGLAINDRLWRASIKRKSKKNDSWLR
jgi:L-threonylcarbamoyladenylate synthase